MRPLIVATVFASVWLAGCAVLSSAQIWDPMSAVAAADRDITAGRIRFCFVGGRAPVAPGVPDHAYAVMRRYPRIPVGPQGCIQDSGSDTRWDYARRYNIRMWRHVSRMPRKSSNQAMERTATRRAFTLCLVRSSPLPSMLALGGRRSSYSR